MKGEDPFAPPTADIGLGPSLMLLQTLLKSFNDTFFSKIDHETPNYFGSLQDGGTNSLSYSRKYNPIE